MNTENKILLSRFMTRSGDQAWDFAVPLVLIQIFPANMRIAFLYYFLIKLGTVVFMPMTGRYIDKIHRKKALQLGIGLQAIFVTTSSAAICLLSLGGDPSFHVTFRNGAIFSFLTLFGFLSTIGSNIMDIAVANDLVPSALTPTQLPHFNSRLRQLDLLTEVASPIVAGVLLMITLPDLTLAGFFLIGLWNIISFYPEFILLNGILIKNPQLDVKIHVAQNTKINFMTKISLGWGAFRAQPISLVIISYALLWLSVLSPHGVLLTAFLKKGWSLSEPMIGIFRASGAVFGLSATFLYPKLHKKLGLAQASKFFIWFQTAMVMSALICFFLPGQIARYIFLVFILGSRIGLYGFNLGETELSQTSIPENLRGEINGVASSLTSFATLIIFGLGIVLSSPDQFKYLVTISVGAVALSAVSFNRYLSRSVAN